MNCWKSFNLSKDLGSVRLVILSLFGMICYFVIFNLAFTDIFGPLKIDNFNIIMFLLCIFLVYPVHKFLHGVPLWVVRRRAKLTWDRSSFIPKLFCNIFGAIPKRLYLLVILFPFLFLTITLVILTLFYPAGIHYYSVTGSINFGLSVSDFLSFIYLLSAPRHSIIEEDQNHCRVLIKQYI